MKRLSIITASLFSLGFIFCVACPSKAQTHMCDSEHNVCLVAQNDQLSSASSVSTMSNTFKQTGETGFGGDLSEEGERRYVKQIQSWLNSLPEDKRGSARAILLESHSELQSLRKAIYAKKNELAEVCFDDKSSLEVLPKLGLDLQKLRQKLRDKLNVINSRLLKEAGVKMDELEGEGLWLQPLQKNPVISGHSYRLQGSGFPVSMLNELPLELQ